MGNESHNLWLIRGPKEDLDKLETMGSCGDRDVQRESPHCLRIFNRTREYSLWSDMVDLLHSHKRCWIRNYFSREFSAECGIWIGYYQGDTECIQSRLWPSALGEYRYEFYAACGPHLQQFRRCAIPTLHPYTDPSSPLYENKCEAVGINLYGRLKPIRNLTVTDAGPPSYGTAKAKEQYDVLVTSRGKPIHSILESILNPACYIQNMYRNERGEAGVWTADWDHPDLESVFRHGEISPNTMEPVITDIPWMELSDEEIKSFELHGINAHARIHTNPPNSYIGYNSIFTYIRGKQVTLWYKDELELEERREDDKTDELEHRREADDACGGGTRCEAEEQGWDYDENESWVDCTSEYELECDHEGDDYEEEIWDFIVKEEKDAIARTVLQCPINGRHEFGERHNCVHCSLSINAYTRQWYNTKCYKM